MARVFVSVLIDTHNHERFIEEAVSSVLAQDFPAADREILVVDDGSTDRTPDILSKFASEIRILQKPNGGQASAFNLGIPQCRGDIIAFLDGDDWAYAAGIVAILLGAILVFVKFPRHDEEIRLLAGYRAEDTGSSA